MMLFTHCDCQHWQFRPRLHRTQCKSEKAFRSDREFILSRTSQRIRLGPDAQATPVRHDPFAIPAHFALPSGSHLNTGAPEWLKPKVQVLCEHVMI
jgi:hypothetical protein